MSAEQLITKHLDIWTSAHKTRSSAGRGSSNKIDLYGIKKLRELILELAVRGKLVPQDSNDEPASEILKKIELERTALVKQGKLKKVKQLSNISESEKPYDIPDSWAWARLGSLGWLTSSSRVHQKDWTDSGIPFYRTREIVSLSKADAVDNELFISEDLFLKLTETGTIPQKNDIMLTGVGTIGVPYLVKEDDRFYFKDASVLIFKNVFNLSPLFILNFFKSSTWREQIHNGSMGTTVHTLTIVRANDILVPIVPLEEQHRIVAKLEELMAFCDELEQVQTDNIAAHEQLVEALLTTLTNSKDHQELQANWQRIAEHFDTLFTTEDSIDQLKQTILQLAVMGKLVPQDPNDEPASELLKKIAAEKAQLIKEGKIKKEKPLPEITDEEKPFDLPRGWAWYRLGDLLTYKQGAQISVEQQLSENSRGLARYLRITDFRSDDDIRYVADMHQDVYCTEDDLLMIRYGGTASEVVSGKAGIFHNNMFRIDFDARLLESSFLQKFLGIPDLTDPQIFFNHIIR